MSVERGHQDDSYGLLFPDQLPKSFELASADTLREMNEQAQALHGLAAMNSGKTIGPVKIESDGNVSAFEVNQGRRTHGLGINTYRVSTIASRFTRYTLFKQNDDPHFTLGYEVCKPVIDGLHEEVEVVSKIVPLTTSARSTRRVERGWLDSKNHLKSGAQTTDVSDMLPMTTGRAEEVLGEFEVLDGLLIAKSTSDLHTLGEARPTQPFWAKLLGHPPRDQ